MRDDLDGMPTMKPGAQQAHTAENERDFDANRSNDSIEANLSVHHGSHRAVAIAACGFLALCGVVAIVVSGYRDRRGASAEAERQVDGNGTDASIVEQSKDGGVQLWENGPYWAECNVGASKPEEYGYYFWWGDTVGYNHDGEGWNAVDGSRNGFSFDEDNCQTYGKEISELRASGYINSNGNLVAAHDAATAHLGAPWRMPTDAEWKALNDNCDTVWTERNGVRGRLVKGKGAYSSKSIFLPAAGIGGGSRLDSDGSYGLYWSSTRYSGNSYGAWRIYFDSGYFSRNNYKKRYYGQSVRPIRVFTK